VAKPVLCIYREDRWHGKRSRVGTPYGRWRYGVLTRDRMMGISYLPFQGYWWDTTWERGSFPSGRPGALVWSEERVKVRKVKLSDKASVKHAAAMESEHFRHLMPIVEFLAMLQYEDGAPRKPGFFMLWTDGQIWRGLMKDNDAKAKLPVGASTLDKLLEGLCLLLADENAPWEPDDQAERMKARRSGK